MKGVFKKGGAGAAAALVLVCLFVAGARAYIAEFSARWDCGRDVIRVRWETVDETDAIGFYVWSSRSPDGIYARITGELMDARGGIGRTVYYYEDGSVDPYRVYSYQLEKVRTDGARLFYGPVRAGFDCDDDDGWLIATCFIRSLQTNQ